MSPLLENATKIIIVNNISLPWKRTKNSCTDKALIISFLMVAMHRRHHVSSLFIALSCLSKRLNHITLTTYHRRDLSVRCIDIAGHPQCIVDSLKDCHNCLYNFGPLRQGIRRAPISQPPVRRHSIAILCLWKLWKGWEVDPCVPHCAKKDGSFWRWALWDTVAGGALLLLWVLGDSFKCSRSSSSCCILIEFLFESTGRRNIGRTTSS